MSKRKRKSVSKSMRRKKRRRIILSFIVILIVVIGIGIGLAHYFLSGERLKIILSEKIAEATGRPVTIAEVSVNPFGRLDIHGLDIGFTSEENMKQGSFFRLKHLGVRFRLLPLLKKHLVITEVTIDSPALNLVPPFGEEEDAMETEVDSAKAGLGLQPLPFRLGLLQLKLNDFRLNLLSGSNNRKREMILEGLNIEVSGLQIPKKFNESPRGLFGMVRIFTREGKFILREDSSQDLYLVDLDLESLWHRTGNWDLKGVLKIDRNRENDESEIKLILNVKGVGYVEEVRVEKSCLVVGNQTVLRLQGELKDEETIKKVNFSFGGEQLDIKKLLQTASYYLPDHLMKAVDSIETVGSLKLAEGKIWGDLDRLHFQSMSELSGVELHNHSVGVNLTGLDVAFKSEGVWSFPGLETGKIEGNISADTLQYRQNDTLSIDARNLSIHWHSLLDSAFSPVQGNIVGQIGDILEAEVGLDVHWNSGKGECFQIEDLFAQGHVRVDSIQLNALPWMESELDGKVHISADLEMRGVKDIRVDLMGSTTGIIIGEDIEKDTIPPFSVCSLMNLQVDPQFQIWTLDSMVVSMNDVMDARVSGRFSSDDGAFSMVLNRCRIYNKKIPALLPGKVREKIEGLELYGVEEITADVQSKQIQDSTYISFQGKLQFVDAGMKYPLRFIEMQDINGCVEVQGSSEKIEGKLKIYLDRIVSESMRTEPVLGTYALCDFSVFSVDSLKIENGTIVSEDLGLRGGFSMAMDQTDTFSHIAADAELAFCAEDFLEIVNGFTLRGDWSCKLHAESIHSEKQRIHLAGELDIDSLGLMKGGVLKLIGINGRIPFQMDVDQVEKRVLLLPEYTPRSWVDYDNNRDLYRSLFPEIGNLQIETLEVAGYWIDHILLDMEVGSGFVDIPMFSMNLLDGNFGGSLRCNVGTGMLEDISYEIRAQGSRLNSASLANLKKGKEEETEMNATLAFKGRGIDISKGIDLDGFFHITKMGAEFASTLLESMDPKGSNRSIRLTKRLLKMGWKPKIFSFELRHGYVYPSLALSQPWFSPVRIPGQLEYGRLPLAFFLKSISVVEQ